jgi:hypothetical protein
MGVVGWVLVGWLALNVALPLALVVARRAGRAVRHRTLARERLDELVVR